MITHPAPWSALLTLPLPPDARSVAAVLAVETAVLLSSELDVVETIPAFNALLVTGRPASWDPGRVTETLAALARTVLEDLPDPEPGKRVDLPACYDPDLAPDLASLAAARALSPEQVALLHASADYTVLAVGFAPGFAYLGDVDARLATPRHTEPRLDVPAGSVGIADRRTAVYPSAGPGGWQLIARVPPALFEDARERLSRFEPGFQVRFRAMTTADFLREA